MNWILESFEQIINSILTKEEIDAVLKSSRKDKQHPLKRLLKPSDDNAKQVLANTQGALKQIFNVNKDWLVKQKKRLLDLDDYSTSASFLGEIRAYGYLLESGINITESYIAKGNNDPTPDFKSDKLIIDVYSKQMNDSEAKALEIFLTSPSIKSSFKNSKISDHSVTPFGKPKSGENVTENVIQKLAQIKQKEKQFSFTNISILWIDFQDESWDISVDYGVSIPVSTWNGQFYSGGLWYAFYGWKDAPIFEGDKFSNPIRMRHPGRYRNNSKIDAVISSFPRKTVIFENPYSKKQIKGKSWEYLIELPWFAFEYSYMNYPKKNLQRKVNLVKEDIEFIAKKFYR